MQLLYEGVSPPDQMPKTAIRAITGEECDALFAAGRNGSRDYVIIVRDGPVDKYWTPVPEQAPPEYEYPSEFEILMARLDVMNDKINSLKEAAP